MVRGDEVALEGILLNGELRTLAILDKPDPLVGPYFEETMFVTPSRLSPDVQDRIEEVVARVTALVGLREGPIHAELRVNEQGVWPIEIAHRERSVDCAPACSATGRARRWRSSCCSTISAAHFPVRPWGPLPES